MLVKEDNELLNRVLDLQFVLKLTFLCGFVLGGIAAPFYAFQYLVTYEYINALLVITLTPIANGLFVAIYGLFGYPVYSYMAKRGKFGLNITSANNENT